MIKLVLSVALVLTALAPVEAMAVYKDPKTHNQVSAGCVSGSPGVNGPNGKDRCCIMVTNEHGAIISNTCFFRDGGSVQTTVN